MSTTSNLKYKKAENIIDLGVKKITAKNIIDSKVSFSTTAGFLWETRIDLHQFFDSQDHLAKKIEGYYCSLDSYTKQAIELNNFLARYISTFFDENGKNIYL